ncbi:putative enzyme related to lactoylglutathione lyase [Glaciihabitans tibetensis]|uniref:Putative enzyme related to lactoylglutathione lyase n=1 Tax=Glaciihabitans tibetensis TaxID=1266600 RepID=A0A2T0VCF7_9MICO|nr:VOC family protein [Glaciihabitans tibetensis]PRY67863.1 putative enzyme related to lactoylglutathione lyase [Glaciihabitans tibetensis]
MTETNRTAAAALRGLATVSLWAEDLPAAVEWYRTVLAVDPYFVRPEPPEAPMYVEFRIGDSEDELGIIDRRFGPPAAPTAPGGAVVYWHVDDLQGTYDRLLEAGATEYEPPTPREAGFVTAAVVDPFGNVLGVMYNPHWLEHSKL